jgi:fimbrial chaperone protein
MTTARAWWWAAPLLVLGGARPAAAAVDVSPIRIELSGEIPNALVALTNTSDDTARFELRIVSWSQDEAGKMDLQPTKDVFLYPPLLSLKPHERRNARVGVAPALFGPREKTYRLIVDELPGAPRVGTAVRIVTRLSIPVFVAPVKAVADLRLEGPALAKGTASLKLVNGGTVEQRPVEVTIEALDDKGHAVAQQRWDGWYVLAGGARDYAWDLPPAACATAAVLVAKARFEQREIVARTVPARGECAK